MEEQDVYALILQAKDEASAVLAEVSASMQGMAAEIQKQTIIAGQSFAELNRQSQLMADGMAATEARVTASAAAHKTAAEAAAVHKAALADAAAASATAEAMFSRLGTAVTNASTSFAAVEQDVAGFKNKMMEVAIIALPVAIAGGDFLKQAGDYQAAILKIQGLTSATSTGAGNDIGMWTPAMLDMSRNGTKSAQELADAMFFVASTQLHGADALHVLDEAQQASTGGMGKMSDLAQVLGGSLNAYVGQAERAANATKYMDEITMAVVQGHMDPATLAPQIGRVGPQAANMGVPFADVLAMISTGTHVGMPSSAATTGTAGILTTLGAPGKSTSAGLESIGIDPLTMATRIRTEGMPQTLQDIKQQMELVAKGDDNIKQQLLKEIFPNMVRGGRFFNVLTNVGGDITDSGMGDATGGDANFLKQIDASITNNSTGVTSNANATALEGFNAQMAILKNNVDYVGIKFGEWAIPQLTPIIKDLSGSIGNTLTQLIDDAIKVGQAIGGIAQAFGGLAQAAGFAATPLQIVEGFLLVMGGMAVASAATAILGFAFDIGALVVALGGLVFAIPVAVFQFATMGAAARAAAIESIGAWLAAAAPIALGIAALVAISAFLVAAWVNDWGGIQGIVHNTAQFIADNALAIIAILSPILTFPLLIWQAWATDWNGIQEIVGNAVKGIKENLAGLMDTIASNKVTSDFFQVPQDWRDQWSAAAAGVTGAVTTATTAVGNGFSAAGSAVNTAKDAVAAAMTQARSSLDALQGPNALSFDAKAAVDKFMADIAAAQAAAAAGAAPAADGAPPVAPPDATKLEIERQLLDLKKQALNVEGEMLVPQQHLADLQAQMKEAAQEQLKLADDQRLLMLDAADFNQNADLKRVNQQIAQQQENYNFETNPTTAGEIKQTIDALKIQAHDIRASMFGDDNTRLEAQIAQSGDNLGIQLNQNAINQNIAQLTAALAPLEGQKKAIADATALVQHTQAVDALQTKVTPGIPGGGLPITPRADGAPADITPAPPLSQQARDDWASSASVIVQPNQRNYTITLQNPIVSDQMSTDEVIAYLRKGLEEADAAGTPTPAVGSEVA